MGRSQFKSDLEAIAQRAAGGIITGVKAIARGDELGELVIHYHHDHASSTTVRIHAMAQGIAEYPEGSTFMLFTSDDDTPKPVTRAIEYTQPFLSGVSIEKLVAILSDFLEKSPDRTPDGNDENFDVDDDDSSFADFDADEENSQDGEMYSFAFGEAFGLFPATHGKATHSREEQWRIRHDLRCVAEAGYKIGLISGFGKDHTTGIVSLSIRINKLGLSKETLEAWDVEENDYLILLIRFLGPYAPLERIIERSSSGSAISFRVGKSKTYKPSHSYAFGAFMEAKSKNEANDTSSQGGEEQHSGPGFEKLFISNSLDQYLNECFIPLLKLRETKALSWEVANLELISKTGCVGVTPAEVTAEPEAAVETGSEPEGHHLLVHDHLTESSANARSLPLVAMQFTVRYFAKCTEFCLRCHRRLSKEFQALRPYICSDPLCLFQYMAMGFGPSVEHEILTQPYVVDLLVSLCYAAIQDGALSRIPNGSNNDVLPIREFPIGLDLKVPNLFNDHEVLDALIDQDQTLLVYEADKKQDSVPKPGQWIAFQNPEGGFVKHAVVTSADPIYRTLSIQLMGHSAVSTSPVSILDADAKLQTPACTAAGKRLVNIFPYDTDFDSLTHKMKGVAMRHILDTLPSVPAMEGYLKGKPYHTVRSMDQVSPAAASLLQWIVSSNRSCIFQIDCSRDIVAPASDGASQPSLPTQGPAGKGKSRDKERIPDMDGWVQFRFAQGTPDKELRFVKALQATAARKKISKHPTIFAWHGSHVSNWHSIVRSGLDYRDIRYGRAFGNGVYFSPHHSTSMGYCGTATGFVGWPGSDLKFDSCMSLNEIINAPDEFVSRNPHYVVSQTDWHQTRYLFVRSGPNSRPAIGLTTIGSTTPRKRTVDGDEKKGQDGEFHTQPEGLAIIGPRGAQLRIPLSAIPKRSVTVGPVIKWASSNCEKMSLDDEGEDEEDRKFLYMDDMEDGDVVADSRGFTSSSSSAEVRPQVAGVIRSERSSMVANPEKSMTDFVPGSLDLSTLPRLDPPEDASPFATKALGRELSKLQSVQANTPLHQLGWYVEFDNVNNLFQWIVELHSFEPTLPLAQDMKKAGVTSVVLEIRFGENFPMSPPFVRVIRPRFLPFMNGGGGHVTMGGAMCMELLTSSGWSPANSLESVLLQVRLAICNLEPKPARLQSTAAIQQWSTARAQDYGVGEAIEAYIRACNTHGWKVPDDIRRMKS
ncbi:hypothetical protein B0H67DRAFT_522951 [Lasiosphaeris hirsuta]|uniref:UBC core domain-containing protein n=1 Tax=Lasiosphaeris hirsuta TaxID=260670 RepID=A0AA39ZX51_9PEZI|nr:hypothetical protein B0H67DRAFT_522951 [Lasiosphaeris hirsuta]